MSWLTNFVRPKIQALVRKTDVPYNLWEKCPACSQMIFHRDLEANLRVCTHCGHHLRLSWRRRLELLFDDAISLAFWLNGSLSRQCCEFRGEAFLEPKYFGDGLAVALPRNDPQIKMLINNALKRVRQSGRFQELVERYFPVRIY